MPNRDMIYGIFFGIHKFGTPMIANVFKTNEEEELERRKKEGRYQLVNPRVPLLIQFQPFSIGRMSKDITHRFRNGHLTTA